MDHLDKITLIEVAEYAGASKRLFEALVLVKLQGSLLISTLSEYLEDRTQNFGCLKSLDNVGSKTAKEFDELVEFVLSDNYGTQLQKIHSDFDALDVCYTKLYAGLGNQIRSSESNEREIYDRLLTHRLRKDFDVLLQCNHSEIHHTHFLGQTYDSIGQSIGLTRE